MDTIAGARPFVPRSAAWALIALLMVAYVAGYAASTPHTDISDELWHAYGIRHGLAYPLEGPYLGGAVHLGPLWFYLVALPLWIAHGWLPGVLFVGFVCSLKFPLAFHCGRSLVDPDFGLLWAVCMFVPGWMSFEQLIVLNPNAVAAATLLVVAIALRASHPRASAGTFFVLGLVLAIAVHVHPTSVPIFLLVVPVLWMRHRRHQAIALATGMIALGFLLPFLPYAVDEVRGGFQDYTSAHAYLADRVALHNVVNVPGVILGYLWAGPAIVLEYLVGWSARTAQIFAATMTASSAVCCMVAIADRAIRARFVLFAVALLGFAAWVACMRPNTPLQFAWVLGPIVAALTAAGLWAILRFRPMRAAIAALVVLSMGFNVYAIAALMGTVDGGEGVLPARILDIKSEDRPPRFFRDVWFPATGHAKLGVVLCRHETISLHGHLGYIVDKDLGLDSLFECNRRSQLSLLGGSGVHYFGMTRAFWAALRGVPECWIGSLGVTTHMTPLVRREPLAIADGSRYLPRELARSAPIPVRISVMTPRTAAVMITNVVGEYERFSVAAQFDGKPVAPLIANDLSALFAVPAGGVPESVEWTFAIATTNLAAVDVVAIGRRTEADAARATCPAPANAVLTRSAS